MYDTGNGDMVQDGSIEMVTMINAALLVYMQMDLRRACQEEEWKDQASHLGRFRETRSAPVKDLNYVQFRFSWKHKGSQVKLTIKHPLTTKSHLNFKQFCRKVGSSATNIGHAPAWNRLTAVQIDQQYS